MGKITPLKRQLRNALFLGSVVVCGALAACERAEVARIDGSTDVLDMPYPKEWASSKSKTIAVLSPGEQVEIIGYEQGKDFIAYRVRLTDGTTGFLIGGDKFHLEAKK
jgi:hypothetical protein